MVKESERTDPQYLLVVTADGHGKRLALDELRCKGRNLPGVRVVSSSEAVAGLVVGPDDEVVLATAAGIVERLAVASIPVRQRLVQRGGRMARGPRLMRLDPGDEVASVSLAQNVALGTLKTPPYGPEAFIRTRDPLAWSRGQTALLSGERFGPGVNLRPSLPLDELTAGGEPATPAAEWAATDIHKHSTYLCGHCGTQHPDPHAVYGCIDAHIEAQRAGALR